MQSQNNKTYKKNNLSVTMVILSAAMIASQSVSIWDKGIKDEKKKILFFYCHSCIAKCRYGTECQKHHTRHATRQCIFRLHGLKFHLPQRHFL